MIVSMIARTGNWRLQWKYRKSVERAEKARLQLRIYRQHRKRLERLHPDKDRLPLGVWIQECLRTFWYYLT